LIFTNLPACGLGLGRLTLWQVAGGAKAPLISPNVIPDRMAQQETAHK
jgi:hypothetical protein